MKFVLAALAVIAITGWGTVMNRYESPVFKTVVTDTPYEIRAYEPALMASTQAGVNDSGFRDLFRYIQGNNSRGEKISMTVPVRTDVAGKKSSMSFFMPHSYEYTSLPEPISASVVIRELPGGTYAVRRFSGRTSGSKIKRMQAELLQWIITQDYQATGEQYLDRFDPPWTLWFLKTNELVVKVERRDK